MADIAEQQVRPPAEPAGRTLARRRYFERRMDAAQSTRDQLKAATDYFWGTFAGYPPAEIQELCHRLAELADSERRRLRGT